MIHEKGITLSSSERQRLEHGAMSQDRQIAILFRSRPTQSFTFYDIVQATGFNQDSVKRSLSNMAGSKGCEDKYCDDVGRLPLVKLDEKRMNPDSGIRIHCYQWNSEYNKPPTHRELIAMARPKTDNYHLP